MAKNDLHPKYFDKSKISCACGNVIEIGSTRPETKVEICSHCHPFYTGEKKLVDVAGRVERFKNRTSKKVTEPKLKKTRTKKIAA